MANARRNNLNELDIKVAEIKKDIGYIKDALVDNKEDHQKIYKLLNDWIKESESKFASKWVEKGLISIMVALIIFLITFVLKTVFKINI